MNSNRQRVKLYLTYDGSAFQGWQRQTVTNRTVQEAVEAALSRVCNERLHCTASGRTDSGVHARIQIAHVDIPERSFRLLESGRFPLALNSLLPRTIRVLRAEAVSFDFHARRGVTRKTYLYFIDPSLVQWPALRAYAWNLRFPLNWQAMEEATKALQGTHDFKAFCDADASTKTSVRTLYEARWGEVPSGTFGSNAPLKVLRLTGNGFLKHMVRSITGTLVKVGEGKVRPDLIAEALKTQNRSITGPTAPPQGLWLWDILYLT